MQTGASIDRFLGTVATFSRELNTARKSIDVFFAINKVLKRFFEIDSVCGLEKMAETWNKIYCDESFPIEEEEVKSFLELVEERKSYSFFPVNESRILILPSVKSGNVISVFFGYIKEEPEEFKQEYESIMSFISVFSGIVLENLQLYGEVLKSAEIQEKLKKYFQNILNSLDEGICVINEQIDIAFVNEKYTKLSLSDEVVREIKNIAKDSFDTGKSISLEKEFSGHFYSFSAVIMNDTNEVLIRLEDITNSKELERLKKIDQMKTEFIANISHELRTPLAAIKAYSETIKDSFEVMDTDTINEFMGIVLDQSNHLGFLLDQLLDFSRVENHNLQLEIKKVNLKEMIESTYKTLSRKFEENKVEFRFNVSEEDVFVSADENRIKQVLNNLLENSIKYRDKGAEDSFVEIVCKINHENKTVEICVKDNGIGISEENKEKVFDKFFRENNSLTYEVEGTGMGLAITREIINKHGNRIWVENGEEKGSKFCFTLDLIE